MSADRRSPRARSWAPVLAFAALAPLMAARLGGAVEPQARAVAAPRENVALGKSASASSTQDDGKWAGAAIDGDPDSRWCASDGSLPQWLQVDLGRPESLTGCRVAWEAREAPYSYKVETSPDGRIWTTRVDATRAPDNDPGRPHTFGASGVRHVRLTVTGTADGQWASLFEFEVFGIKPAAAATGRPGARGPDPQAILREIKLPAGFEATVFAAPPDVRYPTCLAAAPTGEVFVGVDENGSLDAKADRGRVVRCVDADGDGKADKFNVFATMDSPRGLAWDAGTLYVLHPPTLSAFRDTDGDGAADKRDVLVEGIGFDLKHRGADHTTNGVRLAIDGFLYVAVGDYGFVRAQGKDGGPLQLLGGGVVRVRTDGTGLEIVSRGQRNIYDVAIDPRMNLFTRDNTNDGDGWDVRLSHVVPTGHYGYPSLFKRFTDETIPPLADYGGGSPCGSLYLQEPGFPAGYGDTLYTCEWGRGAVFMHPLKPKGATFEAGQETFVTIPRPTDMDVDGTGQIFISSWRDGGFTYSKPTIGYVVRVVPVGHEAKPFPELARADPPALIAGVTSDSSVLRLAAQRELLRRGLDESATRGLEAAVQATSAPTNGRIAALFTLSQGLGSKVDGFLAATATARPELAEFALRALADRRERTRLPMATLAPVLSNLTNPDPRTRLAAVVASGRLLDRELLPAGPQDAWRRLLIQATNDPDAIVVHAAVKALVRLGMGADCVYALTYGDDETRFPRIAQALGELHDPETIPGLTALANLATAGPVKRRAALAALCRMYHAEAAYQAGQWWGTRPDTTGPYYKPVAWSGTEAIGKALTDNLAQADPALSRWLLGEMIRNRVDLEAATSQAIRSARTDPELGAAVVDLIVGRPRLAADAADFLRATAVDPAVAGPLRVRAARGLLRHAGEPTSRPAALAALAAIAVEEKPDNDLVGVWADYAKDNRHLRDLGPFVKLAEGSDPGPAMLGYGVLLGAASNEKASEKARTEANDALARGWDGPARLPSLLRAVGLARATSQGGRVQRALDDGRTEVRRAAEFAARRMNIAAKAGDRPGAGGKAIAATPYDAVLAAALKDPGDVDLGGQLFERQGCVNCHAVAKSGPIKGPYLGDVAARYNRGELVESILKPSARIAQGFETQKIATTDGRIVEGFVVREAGTEVELRNSAGAVVLIPKADIDERSKGELSVMPVGLMDPLSPHDLASLIAYLESIKGR